MTQTRPSANRRNAAPAWEIQFTEEFFDQLRKAPDRVHKSLRRNDYERLKNPCDGPEVKHLRGWKDLYRLRVGDYRVIYRADATRRRVRLLKVGHRKSVYEQLGHNPERDRPCARIIADPRSQNLIDRQLGDQKSTSARLEARQASSTESAPLSAGRPLPSAFSPQFLLKLGVIGADREALRNCRTEDELLDCAVEDKLKQRILDALFPNTTTSREQHSGPCDNEGAVSSPPQARGSPSSRSAPPATDRPLPPQFDSKFVQELGIVGTHFEKLVDCKTEGDLVDCPVPNEILTRVLDALWPDSLVRSADAQLRVVDSADELDAIAASTRDWTSFLLALDDNQQPFVERFTRPHPRGPWILKGGPGSGKSTVALYCIRNLLRGDQSTLQFGSEPLRILFTTYTKALTTASRQLLDALGIAPSRQEVELINVDRLAKRHAPGCQLIYNAGHQTWLDVVDAVLKRDAGLMRTLDDPEFLYREMNEVIVGNEIGSSETYLNFKRHGQQTALGPNQREQVWRFCLAAWQELKARKRCLPSHMFRKASKSVCPTYDYVFIDEAQDLVPVAIRMCVKLSKDRQNVFLTADRNQSIFNSGFSWKRATEDLDFRGRSTILRRNYRTTRQIMNGIRHLLDADQHADVDTRDAEPVPHGPRPELRFASEAGTTALLGEWLGRALAEERIGSGAAAVLCPAYKDCEQIAGGLANAGFASKAMRGWDFDLRFDGIKVTTMHGAKGLEFPIVAVVGLADGRMPWTNAYDSEAHDETSKLRRTFFVACSRAMRRLLVVADPEKPSPFVEKFDSAHWNVA